MEELVIGFQDTDSYEGILTTLCHDYSQEIIAEYSDGGLRGYIFPDVKLQNVILGLKIRDLDMSKVNTSLKFGEVKSLNTKDKILKALIGVDNEWDVVVLTLQYASKCMSENYLPKIDILLRSLCKRERVLDKVWESRNLVRYAK